MSLVSAVAVLLFGLSFASGSVRDGTTGPLWFNQGRLTQQASQLLGILESVQDYGLDPQDYHLQFTADERNSLREGGGTPDLRAQFDAALKTAATRFLMDVRYGRIDARAAGFDLPMGGARANAGSMLARLASSSDVAATVASLEPRPAPYHSLKKALHQYRGLAAQHGLNALPAFAERSLQTGDEYSGAPQLRVLLTALGDLPAQDAAAHAGETQIDELLAAAVARFQARHGLTGDSLLGRRTFAALTVPLQERVRQLELTLERWRWITARERPDIVVNIPQFKLSVLRRGEQRGLELEMPVIVGQDYPDTRTPIFTATIRQVVFHPYWDVPSGILNRELLPLIRRNVTYLARHHMEIVRGAGDDAAVQEATPQAIDALASGRYRLRQRPGPDNALGAIKFVMPNPYNVYLHSTPEEALFQRARRAFSHGCIRVSEPLALAEYVLRRATGDWTAAAIEAQLAQNTTKRITLAQPVRVVVFYSTAAASESMGVMFYEDLYGHDRTLQALLDEPRP